MKNHSVMARRTTGRIELILVCEGCNSIVGQRWNGGHNVSIDMDDLIAIRDEHVCEES